MKKGKRKLPANKNKAYLRIMQALGNSALKAQDIANKLNIDQSTIIRHLQYLTEKDILKIEYIGKTKFYWVNWNVFARELLGYYEFFINILDAISELNTMLESQSLNRARGTKQ